MTSVRFIVFCCVVLCATLATACTQDADCAATAGDCEVKTCQGGACVSVTKPAGAVCRASVSSCDFTEFCDGTSTACPADASACYEADAWCPAPQDKLYQATLFAGADLAYPTLQWHNAFMGGSMVGHTQDQDGTNELLVITKYCVLRMKQDLSLSCATAEVCPIYFSGNLEKAGAVVQKGDTVFGFANDRTHKFQTYVKPAVGAPHLVVNQEARFAWYILFASGLEWVDDSHTELALSGYWYRYMYCQIRNIPVNRTADVDTSYTVMKAAQYCSNTNGDLDSPTTGTRLQHLRRHPRIANAYIGFSETCIREVILAPTFRNNHVSGNCDQGWASKYDINTWSDVAVPMTSMTYAYLDRWSIVADNQLIISAAVRSDWFEHIGDRKIWRMNFDTRMMEPLFILANVEVLLGFEPSTGSILYTNPLPDMRGKVMRFRPNLSHRCCSLTKPNHTVHTPTDYSKLNASEVCFRPQCAVDSDCPSLAVSCSIVKCVAGICQATKKATGTVCRPAAGVCDVAESCDGNSFDCPADALVAANTECRASGGVCDVAEKCNGVSAACPVDSFVAAGTVCRDSTGACDVAEACTGSSATCPANAYAAAGTECRPATADSCAVVCSGTSTVCPLVNPNGCSITVGDRTFKLFRGSNWFGAHERCRRSNHKGLPGTLARVLNAEEDAAVIKLTRGGARGRSIVAGTVRAGSQWYWTDNSLAMVNAQDFYNADDEDDKKKKKDNDDKKDDADDKKGAVYSGWKGGVAPTTGDIVVVDVNGGSEGWSTDSYATDGLDFICEYSEASASVEQPTCGHCPFGVCIGTCCSSTMKCTSSSCVADFFGKNEFNCKDKGKKKGDCKHLVCQPLSDSCTESCLGVLKCDSDDCDDLEHVGSRCVFNGASTNYKGCSAPHIDAAEALAAAAAAPAALRSSTKNVPTAKSCRVVLQMTVDAARLKKGPFERHMAGLLATTEDNVVVTDIQSGSAVVDFTVTTSKSASEIEMIANAASKDSTSTLRTEFAVVPGSFQAQESSSSSSNSRQSMLIIAVSVVGIVAIVGLVAGAVVLVRNRSKKTRGHASANTVDRTRRGSRVVVTVTPSNLPLVPRGQEQVKVVSPNEESISSEFEEPPAMNLYDTARDN